MTDFNFFYLVEVRYGDLDPQGHVNNAKFLTYFEQTRGHYLIHLGLFEKDRSFMDVGIILAEVQVNFLYPVNFGMQVRIGARTTRLGSKSFDMVYSLQAVNNPREFATGSAVLVTYDYQTQNTISIPKPWRDTITKFENL